MMRTALAFAALGWPVLPLVPRSKVPLTEHGAADATTLHAQIRKWWTCSPNANLAVTLSGRLVVDVDPRNGGDENWSRLCVDNGEPNTLTARTGSGGLHYVFEAPDFDPKNKLASGIDVKHGPNQYIVVAPSVHPCGGRYKWTVRMVPRSLPLWLVNLLRRNEPTRIVQPTHAERRDKEIALRRACRYIERCAPATQGQNGSTTTLTVVIKLATNFPELGEGELWNLLIDYSSRCLPPWSQRELMHKLHDGLRIARGTAA